MEFVYFLGGHDLEMLAIGSLLREFARGEVHDRQLAWGALASAYADLLHPDRLDARVPVLVELEVDLDVRVEWCVDWLARRTASPDVLQPPALLVDHHGRHAGAVVPTALRQVFDLLELPERMWTRRLQLIAANDRAHIQGLVDAGATTSEIVAIRAQDRRAQGITEEEEHAAVGAIDGRSEELGGRLTVVRLPTHRASAVVDRMDIRLGGPGYQNLLCVSAEELNFFGSGVVVRRLHQAFPGSWCGGNLSPANPDVDRGFWGIIAPDAASHSVEVREIVAAVLQTRCP